MSGANCRFSPTARGLIIAFCRLETSGEIAAFEPIRLHRFETSISFLFFFLFDLIFLLSAKIYPKFRRYRDLQNLHYRLMTDLISFSNYLFVFINCHAEKFEIRLGETYKRVPFLAFPKTWRLKRQDDESALIDRPDERTIEEIGEEVSARRGGREGG